MKSIAQCRNEEGMDRKLIFLDIDGTLTMPGSNVPPESALRAIRRAQEKGNLLFLCTGRNYAMLKPLLQYHFDGLVGSSGGYVECGGQIICDKPMADSQKDRAIALLEEHNIFYTIESRDGSYTDEGFKEFLRRSPGEGSNSEMLRWREQIEESLHILSMKEYKGESIYKIVTVSPAREPVEAVKEALGTAYHYCIQDSDSFGFTNGELMRSDFDKGTGILNVCEYLGLPVEQTVAFGDSTNDLEMMETAALSICMGNGSPRLKEIADDVCGTVEEDGLLSAFEKCHLA